MKKAKTDLLRNSFKSLAILAYFDQFLFYNFNFKILVFGHDFFKCLIMFFFDVILMQNFDCISETVYILCVRVFFCLDL